MDFNFVVDKILKMSIPYSDTKLKTNENHTCNKSGEANKNNTPNIPEPKILDPRMYQPYQYMYGYPMYTFPPLPMGMMPPYSFPQSHTPGYPSTGNKVNYLWEKNFQEQNIQNTSNSNPYSLQNAQLITATNPGADSQTPVAVDKTKTIIDNTINDSAKNSGDEKPYNPNQLFSIANNLIKSCKEEFPLSNNEVNITTNSLVKSNDRVNDLIDNYSNAIAQNIQKDLSFHPVGSEMFNMYHYFSSSKLLT